MTFTPSQSGTLTVAGGGTGVTSFGASQLLYGGAGGTTVAGVATSSATINNGLTGTLTTIGSGQTIGLATINAGVLGAVTNGSVPTSQATSTLYGTGTGGQILTWNNGVPQWVASTTYSSGLAFSAGNVTNTGVLSLTPER